MAINLIKVVIKEFYHRASIDPLIGHHFNFEMPAPEHLKRIEFFWANLLLPPPAQPYSGTDAINLQFFQAHMKLPIQLGQLDRWVFLFHQTLDEIQNAPTQFIDDWKQQLVKQQHFFATKILPKNRERFSS
jgi:truncated hemoglobin YjbI